VLFIVVWCDPVHGGIVRHKVFRELADAVEWLRYLPRHGEIVRISYSLEAELLDMDKLQI
jgi:hypothetical protein